MSIKTTLGQLKIANDLKVLARVLDLVPPGAYKFRAAKLLDAVEADLKGVNKQHMELLKKYGVEGRDERGNKTLTTTGAKPEDVDTFNEEFDKLLESETTIPYEPILWSKLGAEAQEKLTVGDVLRLGPLLVDDTEAPTHPAPAAAALEDPAKLAVAK